MINSIKTLDDVKNFAIYLIRDKKISIHPDDDFNDYVDYVTGESIYTKPEAKLMNDLMGSCFKICEDEGEDIYEIMNRILLEETGLNKI